MIRFLFIISFFLLWSSPPIMAASKQGILHMEVNLSDRNALQRGARIFTNYCLSCHSAKYMRYNRMARDLAIPNKVLETNFIFDSDVKPGDVMDVAMRAEDGERYFGVAPPDLSVIARARGADWLYTYFKSFYQDDSRPFGVNNLVFNSVGMPHILWELQGMQSPVYRTEIAADGSSETSIAALELTEPGEQSAEEYDQTVQDLVNFLVYLGEPAQLQREKYGVWVILYLIVLLITTYLLKKEYWRDVD